MADLLPDVAELTKDEIAAYFGYLDALNIAAQGRDAEIVAQVTLLYAAALYIELDAGPDAFISLAIQAYKSAGDKGAGS